MPFLFPKVVLCAIFRASLSEKLPMLLTLCCFDPLHTEPPNLQTLYGH